MSGFVEWHARSAFSFLRGASQPEALVRRAAALGMPGLAVCDHAGFYGSARVQVAAAEVGLRAWVGTTLDFCDGTSLPLLAATREGYQNLSRLQTRLHLEAPERKVAWLDYASFFSLPEEALAGVVCLSGDGEGLLSRLLAANKKAEALRFAGQLVERFGVGQVVLEVVRHRRRGERRVERALRDLGEHLGLSVMASNAPLFAEREARFLHDALTCLRHHTRLDEAGRLLECNGERTLKGPEEMEALFADFPEALAESGRLAERVEFTLENLGYEFPSFRDPATGRCLSRPEEIGRLREEAWRGLKQRCPRATPQLRQQVAHELSLIERLGFSGYFLVVWSIKEFARGEGILCQGRGSAANSVVCYALGITNVNPMEQQLLFERFLSENRKSWPDIDIDFPSGERRERVIQHVFDTYAPYGAAMTANVITYKPRSAFREMSKVLGFPEELANRFSEISASPRSEDPQREVAGKSPKEAVYPSQLVDGLEETFVQSGVAKSDVRFLPLRRLYQEVLRLPRHLGQHSGGMVFTHGRLDQVVPLEPAAMPNRTVVQWDKDDCEDLGIVKVDLLGLGMMAVMEDVLTISRERGEPVDLGTLPKDDAATYELMCQADTVGTFQVESRAQMATLPILRPRTFYDVCIEVAIIRPGPIVGDLVHPYLNRRTGREPIDCIHPAFEQALERTLGVPLFQEQILQMGMLIADFTGSEADELRRAMSFKRSDERMQRVIAKLRAGMTAKRITEEVQDKVVHSIQSFALYGFPESHAISFGLLAYASCWLKVHRPAAFYAALLNNQPMGFYAPATLIRDAKKRGLRVRPVSVVASAGETTVVEDRQIRLGLSRLKGLAQKTSDRLLREREARPFVSLSDFLARVRPSKKERRILAESGACNDLPRVEHRRQALWQAELPLMKGLFAARPMASAVEESPLAEMSPGERLAADFATMSHTTGPHPMTIWRRMAGQSRSWQALSRRALRAEELLREPHGRRVEMVGMVICRQRPGTAKGHCFLSLEDESGIANVFVPKKTYQANRLTITREPFLWITGRVQVGEGEVVSLYAESLEGLPQEGLVAAPSHDFH